MIGTFTYAVRCLRFPALCEVCGCAVGHDGQPYYFAASRGQQRRYRCLRCRHGKPTDETSRTLPTGRAVPLGSRWTDAGASEANVAWARLCEG
jgi:hypothetical protein